MATAKNTASSQETCTVTLRPSHSKKLLNFARKLGYDVEWFVDHALSNFLHDEGFVFVNRVKEARKAAKERAANQAHKAKHTPATQSQQAAGLVLTKGAWDNIVEMALTRSREKGCDA